MEALALLDSLSAPACLLSQAVGGLKIGMLLFLVASGLTLIFGVLGIINFAHGILYMLGAYFAWQAMELTGHFGLSVLIGAIGVGIFGLAFERGLIKRVYESNLLIQILLCYAVILIVDDLVMIIWGDEFLSSIGVPEIFQVPPLFILQFFFIAEITFLVPSKATKLSFLSFSEFTSFVVRATSVIPAR